jgi:hypothetical protein
MLTLSHITFSKQTQRNIGAADFTPNAGPGSSAAGRSPVPADFTGQESSTEGQEGSPGVGTANPSSGTGNRLDPLFINGRRKVCVFCVICCFEFLPSIVCIFDTSLNRLIYFFYFTSEAQTREIDPVDEIVQSYLQGMGFVRADIEVAMQAMQSNETDVVMEYLLNNPRGDDFLAGSEGDNGPTQDEINSLGGEPDGAPAVPDTLTALVGDISAVEDQDVSLALTVDSFTQEAVQTDRTESAGAGIQGQIQGEGQGDGESAADVSVLRRDLGQLINELSRLCVEEGAPVEEGAGSLPPPPSDQSSLRGLPPTGPSSSEATDGSPTPNPTPGPSDPFSTARVSVADARILLQALGRRGLQEVSDAPSLLTPPPPEDGEDSVVSI